MDNENLSKNRTVSSAIDELLANSLNVSPKPKKVELKRRVETNGLSTTHIPAGFRIKNFYVDGATKEKQNKKY